MFFKCQKKLWGVISLNILMLGAQVQFFPANLSAVSGEQDERLHQDYFLMEKLYQGKWNPELLADYC